MSAAPIFQSVLSPAILAWIEFKRALGCRFRTEVAVLADLDRFLVAQAVDALTAKTFAAWSLTLSRLAPRVRRQQMHIVRNLCLHRRRTDPLCFVPDPQGFPAPGPSRRPFIFSEEQIAALLHEAARLPATSSSPLRAEAHRLAVALLYAAGLRDGELVRLAISDYDPRRRTLLVRESKFRKSRLVALAEGVVSEVDHYLAVRRYLPHGIDAPLLANAQGRRQAYSQDGLARGIRCLFRAVGIQTASGDLPRVQDLRHTHAVHVLLHWYRAGFDAQSKLPALAASMGHVSVASTAYYLTLLEPIAEAASQRFAHHARTILNPAEGDGHV